jgi:hypothetical protein
MPSPTNNNAQIVSRKASPLHGILNFTYPHTNIINTHSKDSETKDCLLIYAILHNLRSHNVLTIDNCCYGNPKLHNVYERSQIYRTSLTCIQG